MGFAAFPKQSDGRLTWRNLTERQKSSDNSVASAGTSITSFSSSLSSESEFTSQDFNMAVSDPLVRLTYCFFSNPSNTRCADCRTKLFLDGVSDIFVSYYDDTPKINYPRKRRPSTIEVDRRKRRNSVSYCVFICVDCARAHRSLSSKETKLKVLMNKDESWTEEELYAVEKYSGNDKANLYLERYLPTNYVLDVRSGEVTAQGREVYARAKYEALAFLFPGSLKASETINSLQQTTTDRNQLSDYRNRRKPSRLIDFFCVIGSNGHLEKKSENEPTRGPSKFQTDILDCYPNKTFYPDMSFPQHVSKFVFPDGCIPYLTPAKPVFFTFVLTLETGERLYGAALHIYEENSKTEFIQSFDQLQLVTFFLPKCLTILSHYPLFDTFHSLLLQLHHISLSPSNPIPLERYIAHFTREIPLPPRGKIEIITKLLPQLPAIKISRPSINDLPLMGFSLQPLFNCLSTGNVMVVFACLLSETRVVLCSKYYTLLTPISEALLGLLFPFVWQGCYIPILPYNMLDILDAPFPFLVGVHSRYLREHPNRPDGPVYVDLDDDIVHLGFDQETIDGVKRICGRRTPSLPEKEAEKLRRVLGLHADSQYLPPICEQKGRITYGNFEHMNNEDREAYAHQKNIDNIYNDRQRDNILAEVQLTYQVFTRVNWKNDISFKELTPNHPVNLYDASRDEMEYFSGKQIRLGFLRFFVSLFLDYEKHIDETTGFFNSKSFLSGLGLSDSNQKNFVSLILSTQMFENFIEESVSCRNKPEIKFFTESIIAKKNRSRTRAALSGKKQTPFLSDESHVIRKQYYPTPPSSIGLLSLQRAYFYAKFPRLNKNLIGRIKEPTRWEFDDESWKDEISGSSFRKSSALSETKSLPTKQISKDYVLTGVRDVEWAFQALVYKRADEAKETFFADVLSSAQDLILSAREKQLSILSRIVTIQSLIRMYAVRREFVHFRNTVILMQRRRKAIRVGSSYTLVYTSRSVESRNPFSSPDEDVEVVLWH